MGDELAILHDVAARLESAGISYMVTGSIALSVYAEPRMTRDIDVVVALSASDVDRMVGLFEHDFHLDPDRIRSAVLRGAMFNMIHTRSIVKVDCVVRKASAYRIGEFERRRRMNLAGRVVDVVAPEDLILSKLDWARESRSEVQLRDVRNLVAMVPDLDWTYVRHWADVLAISDLLAEVRE
jgi:hypothetical protein